MARPPNVVVFFTDQQRHDSTGLHGNPLELTPNFDRIASANTHVANSFTCQPVCGPARSCLQTGRYATSTGCWRNGIGLRPDDITLAKCFGAAGYRTGYIGKWHLSNAQVAGPVAPADRGGYVDWLAANALEHTSDAYRTRLWDTDNNPVDLPGYRVDALTDAAIRYIHSQRDRPFFLFVSFLEPHHQNHVDDYPAPHGYRERYTGKWVPPDLAALPHYRFDSDDPEDQRLGGSAHHHLGGYWGMVKRLDEALGRMQDALYSLGLAGDTVLLHTSDHACHFKTRNDEYKRSCHESSIRVPTFLAGPGFEGGGRLRELVSLVDLPPTLLDAAGLEVPAGMQGRSLMPLLRGRATEWPDDVFVQVSESETARAVRTRRWKYSVSTPGSEGPDAPAYREAFLYDLQHDPHELVNLIRQRSHQKVRDVMRARLLRHVERVEGYVPRIDLADVRPSGQRLVSDAEADE